MALWGSTRRPVALDEQCDRGDCWLFGRVRVQKYAVIDFKEIDGEPHAVEVRNLDLVFCDVDYFAFEPMLREQGFTIADDRRPS